VKRVTVWIALDLLLLCAPAIAVAAEPVAPEATATASAHFNRGVELYRQGNLDAALAEFVRANELSPSYRLLFNMAQVQMERHDYVRAIGLLESYLAQGGSEIQAERRAEVEQDLAQLRQWVAALWVSANVDPANVWVNDERVATLPLANPIMLNPGIARVRVEANGHKPYLGELTIAGGDRPRLELSLEPQASAPIGSAQAGTNGVAEPVDGRSGLRVAGLVTGVIGAASLGVGIGFGISAKSHAKTATDICDGNRCPSQEGVDAAETADQHATIATIGASAGAALLVMGTVFWFSGTSDADPSDERAASGVRVAPVAGPSELGMALLGRW
jgi:tetratricopeptide (TPR) repeat protein